MHWPQVTMIVFAAISIGHAMALHGRPKDDNHSVWMTTIAIGLEFWILAQGGFFDTVAK